jgi:hypothetical protein
MNGGLIPMKKTLIGPFAMPKLENLSRYWGKVALFP